MEFLLKAYLSLCHDNIILKIQSCLYKQKILFMHQTESFLLLAFFLYSLWREKNILSKHFGMLVNKLQERKTCVRGTRCTFQIGRTETAEM